MKLVIYLKDGGIVDEDDAPTTIFRGILSPGSNHHVTQSPLARTMLYKTALGARSPLLYGHPPQTLAMAKKGRASRVPGRPKAARNPFFVYNAEHEKEIRRAHPEWDKPVFMRELARRWNALDDQAKEVYKATALEDKARAATELAAFNKLPPLPATPRDVFLEEERPRIEAAHQKRTGKVLPHKDSLLRGKNQWDGLTPREQQVYVEKSLARARVWDDYVAKHGDPTVYVGNGVPIKYSLFVESSKSNGQPLKGRRRKDKAQHAADTELVVENGVPAKKAELDVAPSESEDSEDTATDNEVDDESADEVEMDDAETTDDGGYWSVAETEEDSDSEMEDDY